MKEKLKTAAIGLLFVSALFLTLRTWLYDDALIAERGMERNPVLAWLLQYNPAPAPERFAPVRWQYAAAKSPVLCTVYRDGARLGSSQYETVQTAAEALRVTLGEAMSTAGQLREINKEEWAALMGGESFFFWYDSPVALPLLAAWLSVSSPLEAEAAGIGLALGADDCRLVYQDGAGSFYSAAAELLWKGWPELPALASASLAFEREDLPENSPVWLLLTEEVLRVSHVQVSDLPPYTQNIDAFNAFLGQLSIDSVSTPSYTNEDARVYADGSRLCMLRADGSLQYSNPEAPLPDSPLYLEDSERRMASRVERARALVASLEPLLGDGRFTLSGVREQGDLSIVEFTVTVEGIVFSSPPAYASVTVGDGLVRQADVRLRRIDLLEEESLILPLRYALFLSSGDAPSLCYEESEEAGVYEALWAIPQ